MKLPGGNYSDKIRARFWIIGKEDDNKAYVGIGRIELLEKIGEYGSISRAAKAMGMSYKKAWNLVEGMNSFTDNPLVIKTQGGNTGGGAVLTAEGLQTITQFRNLEQKLQSFLQNESKSL